MIPPVAPVTPVLASFGLIAWLENNRITLPLKGVEANFDVRGDLVSVELCQIYHQDRAQPLDVLYTFPLPGGAAVYRCAPDTAPPTQSAHDVYFLVDRSGSMAGDNWSATCRAFRAFLGNLAPQDRVWVTFFESAFRDLAEKPLPPAEILAEPVVQKLEEWRASGGTELLPALQHVLAAVQKHSLERRAVIVLITDGQVGNEPEIIETMKPLPHLRMFCYGIDMAVNDAFLRKLAAQQRGACCLATPGENMEGKVAGLAAKLRHPVLTDIQAPEGWELPADGIPDLHAGECLTVSLHAPTGDGIAAIAFSVKDGSGAPATLTCPGRAVTDPAIARLWAKQRIEHLLEKGDTAAAVQLSERANIVCRATAFIAWDESERLAVTGPNLEIYQPAMKVDDRSADVMHAPVYPWAQQAHDSLRRGASRSTTRHLREDIEPLYNMDYSADDTRAYPPLSESRASFSMLRSERRDEDDDGRTINAPRTHEFRDSAAPLIRESTPSAWRSRLRALTNIAIPEPLLDVLGQWLVFNPARAAERAKMLEQLAALLAANPEPADALFEWIEQNLEPAFRTAALNLNAVKFMMRHDRD